MDVTLYHLADPARAEAIERDGFIDEAGTYKQTGMDLDGVYFSARQRDSNQDDLGSVVFAIELDEARIVTHEIIEAAAAHRSYAIPAALANSVPRRRLTSREAERVPLADRAQDPAFAPNGPGDVTV